MVQSASARPRPGRKVNVFQALALLLAFLLMAGVGGVLAAGLVMPAVATASAVTDTSVRMFDDLPSELEPQELSQQSRIWAADGSLLATFFAENRIVVPLEDISEHMRNAVIATEDRRFYSHGGVDVTGMARAFVVNVTSDDVEGASTLTQQFVKNTLIEEAHSRGDLQGVLEATASDGTAGYQRKLQEAKMAISLEKRMTKDEILQGYLNIAQFGASVYGVETAARRYFSVSAKDLDYLQAATIAGITQAPNLWDPTVNPEGSERRRNEVLSRMYSEGFITRAEYEAGRETPLPDTLKVSDPGNGCQRAGGAAFFCDYVTKVIRQAPEFGETAEERMRLLFRGGLDIHTTLDLRMQTIADEEVRATIPENDPSGLGTSMVVVEPGTGHIKAMAQNRTYNPRQATEPVPGQTSVNYNADFEYGANRGKQPGSTFKTFVLAEWLRQGKSLNQVVDASQRTYEPGDFTASCIPGEPFPTLADEDWGPGNWDGEGSGQMTVEKATADSVNTAYLNMTTQLDYCGVRETATALGVRTAMGEEISIVPSLTLGTFEASPLTMATAYATFAAGGTHCEPVAITQVTTADGEELPVPSPNCRQAVEPGIASTVTYALSKVMTDGSGRRAQLEGRPSAGKTGTTNRNAHTWFIGYTPELTTAVWVGHPDGDIPMQDMPINGVFYHRVYGSTIAAPAWNRFMNRALEGTPATPFPAPDQRLLRVEAQAGVPNVWGRSVAEARAMLEQAGYRVVVRDRAGFSSSVPPGNVAWSEPRGGTRLPPGSPVTIVVSAGPEPSGGGNPPIARPADRSGRDDVPAEERPGNGNGNGQGNGDGNGQGEG
jgi:membrane peptidoglycan carboxypeptidase